MSLLDNKTAFSLLLSHVISGGRGQALFGNYIDKVKKCVPDLLGEGPFPDIMLECPLLGDPFLDVVLLFDKPTKSGDTISPLVPDENLILDTLGRLTERYPDVSGGLEVDTGSFDSEMAGIHFQPREHVELVEGFCKTIGEAPYGRLYQEMVRRLEGLWEPSYFGIFRGRPGAPLRVAGYIDRKEMLSCAEDPERIIKVFKSAGFTAYDDTMIDQIMSVLKVSPAVSDFQFDIYPDGSIGETFSLSALFVLRRREETLTAFYDGDDSRYIDLITDWGIADDRWRMFVDTVFSGTLPLIDGGIQFIIFPQALKVRWKGGRLQPAKAYIFVKVM
jgi:hypothetical protein